MMMNLTMNDPTLTRRVRFAKVECTYQEDTTTIVSNMILDDDDNDEEENESMESSSQLLLWYQSEDYQKFRSDNKKLMKVYRNLLKQKQRFPVGTSEDDENLLFINEQINNLEEETRGLESQKSLRGNIDYKHRKYACSYEVMKEQARQRKLYRFQQHQQKRMKIDVVHFNDDATAMTTESCESWRSSSCQFELDDIAIRNCVLETSAKSRVLAFTLGLSDATYARQMHAMDNKASPNASIVVEETNENVDMQRSEYGVMKVDDVSYSKVPSRYEDLEENRTTASTISRYHHNRHTISPPSVTKKSNATASSMLRSLHLQHLLVPAASCA